MVFGRAEGAEVLAEGTEYDVHRRDAEHAEDPQRLFTEQRSAEEKKRGFSVLFVRHP